MPKMQETLKNLAFEREEFNQSSAKFIGEEIQKQYEQVMEQFLETYKRGFRSADIEYTLLTTAMPFEVALGTCLTKG